ncbi:ATP synthase F1 subunit gamma [uncultured Subdoligranulum sp.]|uniref:ATP synthase F1 subunit gamma n=1 Tax=uncultured Subdoligranulum sp. TaxID=512298 RepID=UPI0025F6B61A|nr:ATP synthase F1 subunit gamma [uncultured Subdoligranulum sp.]
MESIKEIRTHIDSVQQTLKITNAMYLISSSKLRKARRQLNDVQPYFEKITRTISDILHRTEGVDHVYFDTRPGRPHKVGYIVITGDKGLAGAYNHNVLRMVDEQLEKTEDPTLFLIGQAGRNYFSHKGVNIDGEFMYTAQDPTVYRAREIGDTFVELFRKGHLDEVYVVYTEMVTAMEMEPRMVKLLPLDREAFPWTPRRAADGSERHVVTYVPSPEHVLNHIVPSYLKGLLFGTLVESFCSEQNARMNAMDTATDNARSLLKELSLHYNRARQSAITQEITEIVGGAQPGGDDWDDDWDDEETADL